MIRIEVQTTGLDTTVRGLQLLKERSSKFRVAVAQRMALKVQANAMDNVSGAVLQVRTGHLRRMVAARGVDVSDNVVGWGLPEGDPTAKYGAKQELGGLILPKGQYLRIPTELAKTANGVDRYAGKSLREVPGFVFIKPKGKNPFLARIEELKALQKGEGPKAWYWLVPSVNLPARPWFKAAVESTDFEAIIRDAIGPELEGTKQ